MITINDFHLKAIARAIHFVRSGITPEMSPKHQDAIQRDIDRLDEVHFFCRQQIKEPGLPMAQVPVAILKIGGSLGRKNTKATD